MSELSVKSLRSAAPRIRFTYTNEIAPDLQKKLKASLEEERYLRDPIGNRVGMEKINAKSNTGKYFVEFASSSTLHGLNHLVAPHRHPLETFLAALFIIVALGLLICLGVIFWQRYQNEAVVIILNIDRESFKIIKPSFIICPVPNVEIERLPQVLERYGMEYTPETEEFFLFLSNATYENMLETPGFDRVPSNLWLQILYDLRKGMPGDFGTVSDQTWIITERGTCLATGNVVALYASFEYWKSNNWTVVDSDPKSLRYYTPSESQSGVETISLEQVIRVSLVDPFDISEYQDPTRTIGSRTMERTGLSILQLTTDIAVMELSVRQRKCKFESDGGLITWPIYSKKMCIIECRMRIIQEKCGCRPHFLRPSDQIPVCNAKQLRCIGELKDKLFLHKTAPTSCGCIYKCFTNQYVIKDSIVTELKDGSPTNLSVFTVVMDLPKATYVRIVLFGFHDFLTAVGGAAGLFLGASVLSFIEILFYGTLHMFMYINNIRKYYNKRKRLRSRQLQFSRT